MGQEYYPCYGALLQIAVFPKTDKGHAVPLADYPYIANFEPKRREMYEAVTKSGEILGRSTSTLNVLKGATSADTTEIAAKIGAEVSAGIGNLTSGIVGGRVVAEYANTHGTAVSENTQRTMDDSREKRETYSSSTSLTQMYELFTAYHLGTNRAVFFLVSRPHTVEEKDQFTFVKGPDE